MMESDALDGVPKWVERWGPAALIFGVVLHVVALGIWLLAYSEQVDLLIYRFGGSSILHHSPLYDQGLTGQPRELLFNYPPFAAILFVPLAPVPLVLLRAVVPIVNGLLLVFVIRRCLQTLGVPTGRQLVGLTMLCAGPLLWIEPVRTTLALGQISLALLAILVVDLLPLSPAPKFGGVGVGIAAGIKLTPLLFIPFLLLTGRVRAAIVAAITFLGTVVLGFLVAPSQAAEYWFHGTFQDVSRMAAVDSTGNESLRGMVARLAWTTTTSTAVWLILAVLSTIAFVGFAVHAYRRGERPLAVSLCGLTSAAVSPFAWGYHWVWFVPLAVFLAHKAIVRRSKVAAFLLGLLWVTTAAWITSWRSPLSGQTPPAGLISLDSGSWIEALTRNVYVLLLLVGLFLAMLFLRPNRVREVPHHARHVEVE